MGCSTCQRWRVRLCKEIRNVVEQRLNKFVLGLLHVTQNLVETVCICPCHLCTVSPAVPLPPVWIILGCRFHMGPQGFLIWLPQDFLFRHPLFRGYTSQLRAPCVPMGLCQSYFVQPYHLLYMTWFLLGLFASLELHWNWSHVSSSFVKRFAEQQSSARHNHSKEKGCCASALGLY